MAHRLRKNGLTVEQQYPLEVLDEDGTVLGDYLADLFLENLSLPITIHPAPPKPSDVDAKTHKQLTEAGKILGLRIFDHIRVRKKGYFSFQEAGLIG